MFAEMGLYAAAMALAIALGGLSASAALASARSPEITFYDQLAAALPAPAP